MDRLDKIIAGHSAYSRREAGDLIRKGLVQVNHVVCRVPEAKYDPKTILLSVKGTEIPLQTARCLMLHKPAGYVSATEDKQEKTIVELIRPEDRYPALFPAGRLDKDTTGFLLLTRDGNLCHRIISPKNKIYKTYVVRVEGLLTTADIEIVEKGILLSSGESFLPGIMQILESGEESVAVLKIREGQYHQVKRMMGYLGKRVLALKRIAIGGLDLDPNLKPGEYRFLEEREIEMIFQ